MQERIIEIIVYLLEEFRQEHTEENYSDLSKQLISLGYTESEINLAFSWIFNHLQSTGSGNGEEFSYSLGSNRVLHDVEKLVISAEAYGYVLQLRHLGILSDFDLEIIIDRALALGTTSIEIADIKAITASLLFGSDSGNSWEGYFFQQGNNTVH
ncbi:MAG TPA: DUF494 family protein [Caldithrix abyssi]|uniref:DUF494 family protein n=1 Tax=Caldithrix abyssi TaxID=187145 RepID=A0A7V4UBN1_CALAY|nr:DUF494 family protein [Caldithrix abyssi]